MTLETMLKALHYRESVEEAVKASIKKTPAEFQSWRKPPTMEKILTFPCAAVCL